MNVAKYMLVHSHFSTDPLDAKGEAKFQRLLGGSDQDQREAPMVVTISGPGVRYCEEDCRRGDMPKRYRITIEEIAE